MEFTKWVLLQYGGFFVWFFLLGPIPQIIANYRNKIYKSGPLATWIIFVLCYIPFGLNMFLKNEYSVAFAQFVGLILSLIIIYQGFIYKHAE